MIDLLESSRKGAVTLAKFLRRPDSTWDNMVECLPALTEVSAEVVQQVVHDVKYEGYVARQQIQIDRQQRLASKRIPENLDYTNITHLRAEAREKLSRIRPLSLAPAGRIRGITPADVALLMVHLEGKSKKGTVQ